MLYGDDCLVFFYKSFKTEYSYTPLGRLKNTSGFAKAVGKGGIEITISGKKSGSMSSTTDAGKSQDDSDGSSERTEQLISINIQIGTQNFMAKLYENDTTKEWIKSFPITMNMNELNGNEKYYYLSFGLPVNSTIPEQIHEGDLMLYGSNCIVLFYDTFTTGYSYTSLGFIEDVAGLREAVGIGNVSLAFSLENPDLSGKSPGMF